MPGTKDHVYRDGWLRRFFEALVAERDWLRVATLSEAVDCVPQLGRVYLPDSSYREMTEWALPVERQVAYHDLVHRKEHDPDWPQLKSFVRGGFWRNFLAKYPESNEMYCRMREVSDRIEQLSQTAVANEHPDLLLEARTELYRGQCNCPYWHGAFGGLYLPHLRNAIYRHLIAADNLLERIDDRGQSGVRVDVGDFNLDARKELRLSNNSLVAYVAPARGGHIYELDIRSTRHNLLATLNRRLEAYHAKVLQGEQTGNGDAVSIHDLVKFKQPDLDKKLQYDQWPRKMLVDHFLTPGTTREQFERGEGRIGDFETGVYETKLRQSRGRVDVILSRQGRLGDNEIAVTKQITLHSESAGTLNIRYQLTGLPTGDHIQFAPEFNFAGLAAGADDRYFYDGNGRQLGQLQSVLELEQTERIGLVDEWLGIDASLDFSQPAHIWTLPIQTVSTSEGGFELVHQSSTVVPHWQFTVDDNGCWEVAIELSIDTSLAQAKKLAEARAGV